jgi:diguanylate cyclase (GGDEF)-like protein
MMFLELLAAVALAGGALACVVAAALHPRGRAARLFLAAALACAAAAELLDTGDFQLTIAACVLAAVGAALLFLNRHVAVTRLSRLDAAMAASATAALAVSLGAPAPGAFAAAGIAGVIGLARWRPGVPVVLAVAGLAALGLGEAVTPAAAVLLGTAAWLRTPGADPGPEFSPVVLTAIITFALIALTLLSLGQFAEIADVAVALAIVTVLTGMARAGFTVIERLRESRQLALTDELTGLGNRRHLIQRLDAAVAACAQDGRELALLLVDLDGFKELNDTLGHHAGDQVLRQIGPRLNGLLRSGDTLARLGGDEFAVVLVPADEASASTAGLRLRAALEQSFEVGGRTAPSACCSGRTWRCTRRSG